MDTDQRNQPDRPSGDLTVRHGLNYSMRGSRDGYGWFLGGAMPSLEPDCVAQRASVRPRIAIAGSPAAILAILLLSGCSGAADLQVGHITGEFPDYPPTSVAYALPQKTFVLTTTTTVTDCTAGPAGEVIHGETTLVPTTDVEVDPLQRYYIYFDSGTRAKNLDFVVQSYDNGALQSVSNSIKDQIAPTTAAIVGALVQLAPIAAGAMFAPPPPPVAVQRQPAPNCKALKAAIEQSVAAVAKNQPPDPRLILHRENLWTPDPRSGSPFRYDIVVRLDGLAQNFGLTNPQWAHENAAIELLIPEGASLGTESQDVSAPPSDCIQNQTCTRTRPPLAKGLVLRDAVHAALRPLVCDAACNRSAGTRADPDDFLTAQSTVPVDIPQFGKLFVVPLHSGYAQDAVMNVSMTKDGRISKMELSTVSSLGDNISGLGTSLSGLQTIVTTSGTAPTVSAPPPSPGSAPPPPPL